MEPLSQQNGSRTIGDLIGELARETGTLVRQEVRLATVETGEKLAYAARQAGYVGAGGVLALVGLHALAACIVLALGLVIPLWAGALIVGGCFLLGAAALAWKGIQALRSLDPRPQQTIQSFEDTKSWARQQLH